MTAKLCLSCAREKLAGKPRRYCHDCRTLSADPLAQVRAKSTKATREAKWWEITSTSI